MTVMMHDAVSMLGETARATYDKGDLADLTFADDALLLGVSRQHVEEFLAAVSTAGKRYGLELHFWKIASPWYQQFCSNPNPKWQHNRS